MKNFARRKMTALVGSGVLVMASLAFGMPRRMIPNEQSPSSPDIDITVQDLTTGQRIFFGETITAGDEFQATVTVENNVDCAGQFVLTALGAPGGPPSVLVQIQPFIIGPAVGSDSVIGGILTSNGTPGHPNDWKISASCNSAARRHAFGFDSFEFLSAVP